MSQNDSAAGATQDLPTIADLHQAATRIKPYAHMTPTFSSTGIDARVRANLVFKAENLQKAGAFKFRGACNAVMSLDNESAQRGVITHSSGNHAAALALAARLRGINATIVMPDNAPAVKKAAVASYGARIKFCESTEQAREATVARLCEATPMELIHPYNDARIIAGQGTAALELLAQSPQLDAIIAPIGGGGLLSGTAIAANSLGIKVWGAEPANADDAARSLAAGRIIPVVNPDTVADGLRTSLGPLTFAVLRNSIEGIITVDEAYIVEAMRLIWERLKIIAEPSGAVPLGALLQHGAPAGVQRIGLIISGGNVDLDTLPWIQA
jgi:threonine dehydratase